MFTKLTVHSPLCMRSTGCVCIAEAARLSLLSPLVMVSLGERMTGIDDEDDRGSILFDFSCSFQIDSGVSELLALYQFNYERCWLLVGFLFDVIVVRCFHRVVVEMRFGKLLFVSRALNTRDSSLFVTNRRQTRTTTNKTNTRSTKQSIKGKHNNR